MSGTAVAPPSVAQLSPRTGLTALASLRHGFSGMLPVLSLIQQELGDVFQLELPGFRPVVVARPEAIRQVLVTQSTAFRSRHERDPVTRLLRRGFLVTDGDLHERLRTVVAASGRRDHFEPRAQLNVDATTRVMATWEPGRSYDVLAEMRKVALLSFEQVFLSHDAWADLARLWKPMLRTLSYIGPGIWTVLPSGALPPPRAVEVLDAHLLHLIRSRRAESEPPNDLLTHLVQAFADNDLVRDQLLTMLIAGHDTSTAHLSWTLYLLGTHPKWMERVQSEIHSNLGADPPTPENVRGLSTLHNVLRESLRLFPPIHSLNRSAIKDVDVAGYRIAAGTRLLVSVYLVQRHPSYWDAPSEFRPQRWESGGQPHPFSYVPFGAGARNCVGGAFAQLEAPLILTTLLQRYNLTLQPRQVSPHMGATLAPRPRVLMRVEARP